MQSKGLQKQAEIPKIYIMEKPELTMRAIQLKKEMLSFNLNMTEIN